MTESKSLPAKLVFVNGFSDRDAVEARDRGYLSHVLVQLDERLYPICFYDSIRLQQDMEQSALHGRAFVADPGMIVLSDITMDAMQEAVQRLCDEGFFKNFIPRSQESIANADPFLWPPEFSEG